MRFPRSQQWRPSGTRWVHRIPEPGALIGWDHRVWRVVCVSPRPEDRWTEAQRERVLRCGAGFEPRTVRLRPADVVSADPVELRNAEVSVGAVSGVHVWYVYPTEHYPVCAVCREPPPCREVHAERVADAVMADLARFETAGVCPACQGPVTTRQKSVSYAENLVIPGGPSVTFHLRGSCRGELIRYERSWVAADPGGRRSRFECAGHVTNHNDGTYDCSELADCPGPDVRHGSYSVCRCPGCHAGGFFSCHPAKGSVRNGAAG